MGSSQQDAQIFDPTDPEFLKDPYPVLNHLRENTPVARAESLGLWLVTRHEDVFACQRDARLTRNFGHKYTPEEMGVAPRDARWADFWQAEKWSLLDLEQPDHTRIRSLVSSAFTPRRVTQMRDAVRARSRKLLSDLVEQGEFDLLHDYAMPYSVSIVCELLGADQEQAPLFLDWAHAMVKMYELDTTEEQARRANDSAAAFITYVRELIALRRRQHDDALVSALVQAETEEGRKLTDDEIVSTVIVLLNAGHEATVNTTGNGMTALLRHPGQWARVTTREVAPRQAVEEVIRWDPPLQLFERWVLADDVEIAGRKIPFGSKIAMLYGAANRDPRLFTDPEVLDVGRVNASRHVNFGGGVHACLGAPLARIELEETFTSIRDLCPDLELVEEPRRNSAFVIWGMESVRVAVR
ncbi:cytochrome P450 [Streptomyces sp. NPDC006706]|uniref:cytochrome P450 n=1 Tax=Streptomyces sp. NPDC006706 TaxID=3364761 RepID=UPI00368A49DB